MPRNIERDKREADRRKNQLIEAGFRLFSQNGIETVSLQKVADAANVSPATMAERYAQGLVWLNDPKDDHTQELLHLKEMLLLWCQGEKKAAKYNAGK